MEIYLCTLYTCRKPNILPNDGLDNLLTLQMENGLNFDEIKIRDEGRCMSERNTGGKLKTFRYCQPEEVSESLVFSRSTKIRYLKIMCT